MEGFLLKCRSAKFYRRPIFEIFVFCTNYYTKQEYFMSKPWKRKRLKQTTTPPSESVVPVAVEVSIPPSEPTTLSEPVMAEAEEKKAPTPKKVPRKRKTTTSKPKATKRTTKKATKKVEVAAPPEPVVEEKPKVKAPPKKKAAKPKITKKAAPRKKATRKTKTAE